MTTISCDAVILRCSGCRAEAAGSPASVGGACPKCGEGPLLLDRSCGENFALRRDGALIRCVAENKDGWCCDDKGGRDYCPAHVRLANPVRVSHPTPRAIGEP